MLVGIRVDASLQMGTGHTYRMLTLAHQLADHGHTVFFVIRRLAGNLIELVARHFVVEVSIGPSLYLSAENDQQAYHCPHAFWLEVPYLQEIKQSQYAIKSQLKVHNVDKLDWLIVDSYAIDEVWQRSLRPYTHHILQVDDLADRPHDVDILLDQNYYLKGAQRYDGLLSDSTKRLCGPEFALLRNEFFNARQCLSSYSERLARRRVVLFFGGIDLHNETSKALAGLLAVDSEDHFDVIIGINNPHRVELERLCKHYADRVSLHVQVSNMVEFFAHSYLYIGAVGATTWERCVMALPGIVCSVANNQTLVAQDLDQINGHYYLGLSNELSAEDYHNAYQRLSNRQDLLSEQSKICAALVDGLGCNKVAEKLEEMVIDGKI